jgi:hypothetical protein
MSDDPLDARFSDANLLSSFKGLDAAVRLA